MAAEPIDGRSAGELTTHRRYVIVGINYAPELSGIGLYTTAMAERLAHIGHEVTIVTGMPHYPHWHVREPYRGKLSSSEHGNGVRILRFAGYIPARQSALKRAVYEASFLVNASRAVRNLRSPEAIVSVVPALADAVLARFFAARLGAPYGVIFQDMMGRSAAQSGIAGGGRVASATTWLEGWAARRAKAVGTVTDRFIPELVKVGIERNRIVHLPNWNQVKPPAGDRAATRARLGWDEGETVILHAGNMGLKQNLEQVLVAARLGAKRAAGVRFAFIGDGSQRQRLQEDAADLLNVSFHGFEPMSTFPDVLAAADILLVSERASAADMSLPSKLTSYFAAGRPVVAAVALDGATAQEIKRSGGGTVVSAGNPEELLGTIRNLGQDGAHAHRIAEAGQAYAADTLAPEPALMRLEQFFERVAGKPA